MQIRTMCTEDCVAVAVIEKESFSMPWSEEAFLDSLGRDNYHFFVAEEDGKILGYCGFLTALDEGEIPNVCVAASARRRGIGRMLMEELIRTAKDCGITVLFLEVRQSNVAARTLYTLCGFEEIGIRKGFYELPKEDAILMRLQL